MDTRCESPLHQGMPSNVTMETQDGVLEIVLRREGARNALSTELLEELAVIFESTARKDDVRIVHLRGAGRDFCAGFDLEHLGARALSEGLTEELVRHLADLGHRVIHALRELPSVTMASIQGNALGGGFLLAAACDFRVIASDARIALPEIDLGMPLIWGGVPLLLEEFPPATARDLMMTGRPLRNVPPGFEGFASRVAEPASLTRSATSLLDELRGKPPHALRLLKAQCLAEIPPAGADRAQDADTAVAAILHPEFLSTAMEAIARRRTRSSN